MFSATVMCGHSAYPWNTMPMSRWLGARAVTSSDPNRICPESGVLKPASMRSRVVFPHPEGPTKKNISPDRTVREMPSTARVEPKVFTKPSIWMSLTRGTVPNSTSCVVQLAHLDPSRRPPTTARSRDDSRPATATSRLHHWWSAAEHGATIRKSQRRPR